MYTMHTCKAEYVNSMFWVGKEKERKRKGKERKFLLDVNSRYRKISLVFKPLGICRKA